MYAVGGWCVQCAVDVSSVGSRCCDDTLWVLRKLSVECLQKCVQWVAGG